MDWEYGDTVDIDLSGASSHNLTNSGGEAYLVIEYGDSSNEQTVTFHGFDTSFVHQMESGGHLYLTFDNS
ncbi:MAG TPA: hypothetical protein VHL34_22390 [Rhizomicrobium sp.]|jgi:hypothetical protein|nr:hypothetical protein [Rhizomicrobium sp.]